MAEQKAPQDGSQKNLLDPEGAMLFALEIEGIEVAAFLECSGLKTSTTVFEIEEGGLNQYVHKLPGPSRWENIVLRYGVTSDTTLLQWRNEVLQDQFSARRNGAIIVKSLSNESVRRYSFKNAWPVAWEGPAFNASASELAVEMIEIAHHGIEVS
ncbi:MAG: phage tail protein [Deltaproteobacteria bacterium]|nr:phage tail protein [Deltaproteobacteria bacterium]